jgi:hypothetical protein
MVWRDFQTLSTLSRAGGGEWPSDFDRPADKWPTVRAERWKPARAGRVVVACLRPEGGIRWRSFPTLADAERAERARAGRQCDPLCEHQHTIAYATPGALHLERGLGDPPPVPESLAGAVLQAYPPRRNGYERKERPMTRKPDEEEPAMTEPTNDEAQKIIDAERRAGKHLARIGLNRRAALALREVADLYANGADPETIELAEKVAQTLTDLSTAAIDAAEQGFA